MATVYLYIPFSKSENPEELLKMAKDWIHMHNNKEDLKEILEEDSDVPYEAQKIVLCSTGDGQLKNLSEGDKIYVLAHGMQDTTSVGNDRLLCTATLTQDEVAKRIIEDGLPENLKFSIKLYYCDTSNNALERTNDFYLAFNKHTEQKKYDEVRVFYYPGVVLGTPVLPQDLKVSDKAYKPAYKATPLSELSKTELQKYLKETLSKMPPAELKAFLGSLGLDVVLKIIKKVDPSILQEMQIRAQIVDVNKFLNTLNNHQVYSTTIYQELGKAKGSRKEFEPSRDVANKGNKATQPATTSRLVFSKFARAAKGEASHDTKKVVDDSKTAQRKNTKDDKPTFNR